MLFLLLIILVATELVNYNEGYFLCDKSFTFTTSDFTTSYININTPYPRTFSLLCGGIDENVTTPFSKIYYLEKDKSYACFMNTTAMIAIGSMGLDDFEISLIYFFGIAGGIIGGIVLVIIVVIGIIFSCFCCCVISQCVLTGINNKFPKNRRKWYTLT